VGLLPEFTAEENFQIGVHCHETFALWLETSPYPAFPLTEFQRYNSDGRLDMVTLDFPALLIGFLIIAGFVWGLYNWTHPELHGRK